MKCNIQFTRLLDNDNAIAKRFSIDGNKLVKEAKASVKDGLAESAEFSWKGFLEYLNGMNPNECIVLGHHKHGETVSIVGSKACENPSDNAYSRNLQNFEWHVEHQLLCIDFDGTEAGNLRPDEVISILDDVMPGFRNIKKVLKYSSSAWIYNDAGELLSPSNGFHIYFLVNHPEFIEDTFKGSSSWLHRKLWLAGHGYIKNSKPKDRRTTAVTQMERTVYDNVIFSPERIIFEAPPILSKGLSKTNQDAIFIDGESDFLDLAGFAPLSDSEVAQYESMVIDAKKVNNLSSYMVESRKIFEDHVRKRVRAGHYGDRREYAGKSEDEIVKLEFKASREAILMQDHSIELASGKQVTVREILDDPRKYHEQSCKDPHEPDYGSSTISIIYTDQKVPIIFSHAHGGITYRLIPDQVQKDEPDFLCQEYWLEHFYLVAYDKKDEIYHINGNKIEKYSHSGFKHRFEGYYTDVRNGEDTKRIKMTTWWMGNTTKKIIAGDGFDPDQPITYYRQGELVINEYVPAILREGIVEPDKKTRDEYAQPWLSHIHKMIHDRQEADVLIDWFAFLIQCPSERPMYSPLIVSEVRGVGKDMMTDIFTRLLGHQFAKKSSIEALSKGNGWGDVFYQSKLITVSECGSTADRYTVGNTIKDAITATSMSMNLKGKEMKFGNVYAGIIFFSNSISPFRLDNGDRRFFVTRCDWTKEQADELKQAGHFAELASFYTNPEHLNGLYHYLLNRNIRSDLKGDAPMTSSKAIMMRSEPNDVEQFFIDLRNHPCRYWTKGMIDELFRKTFGFAALYGDSSNKQYKHYLKQMIDVGKMKIKGKSYRVKTFSMKEADMENDLIRKNIGENWEITTTSLHPEESSKSDNLDSVFNDPNLQSYDEIEEGLPKRMDVALLKSVNGHRTTITA